MKAVQPSAEQLGQQISAKVVELRQAVKERLKPANTSNILLGIAGASCLLILTYWLGKRSARKTAASQ